MNDAVKKEVYSTFTLGDMYIRYILEEKGQMDLQIVPLSKKDDIVELKESRGDCLVQAKLIGDVYASGYSGGVTMRNNGTTDNMKFVKQEINETVSKIKPDAKRTEILTYFDDGKNHQYIHTLGFTEGDFALDSKTTFVNSSSETAVLEMLSSFSLGEITPFQKDDAQEMLLLHRIRSKWSEEGYLVTETAEDLQLEPSWAYWPPNSIRYGQVGSMPVKQYAPFGAVEDKCAKVIWAAQLAVECSWQMEFYRRDNSMYFSGGIADREFGHWYKNILSGESFTTPTAILTATTEDIDTACQRLTSYQKKFLNGNPQCEQHLPIMFNEYCTTWGNPSEENIERILKAISGHGMEYFVVDCGWFLEDGKDWSNSMGDYVPNKRLFPNGLISVSKKIHDAGMKAGIWFEIDNVGKFANVYNKEEYLLKRDGVILATHNRRFLDMRKAEVQKYLEEKVIGQLKQNNFDYVKMDYNDTYGLGCDGAESLGEALRQEREASVNFVRKMKNEIPELIIENCASGGHKTEPLMMSLTSMASFSDAHECVTIPVIAANLHRTILPQQSQIWVVIRNNDSLQRIAYSISAAFLGRMCFSGDVTELNAEQWNKIDEGISFYRQIVPVIKNGTSHIFSKKSASVRKLDGWQTVVRTCKEGTLIVTHVFNNPPEEFTIDLPEECTGQKIKCIYKATDISAQINAQIKNSALTVTPTCGMESIALFLSE